MKISILGTNGFLSTAIALFFEGKATQLDMYGLTMPVGYKYNNYFEINLMSEELDYSYLCQSDLIIYAIGAGIQSNLNEGHDLIYNLNVTVPVRICNALKQNGYRGGFITFGSVFEMGETKDSHFFTENEILTSINVAPNDYTVSKRMLTRFVSSYSHNFTHWHFFIPTIYGEMENPKRLIPYTINSIRKGESLHFTSGDQIRQYIYVNEVPRMIELAYENKLPSGLYNIQGMETLTVRDVVTIIHHFFGEEVHEDSFGVAERADVGMKFLALDGSKLKQAIGFEPLVRLVDIINKY